MAEPPTHGIDLPSEATGPTGPADRAKMLKLLELSHSEEQYFINDQHKRVAFFSSLISAILAATIGGAINSSKSFHYFFLMMGPLLVLVLSQIALRGTFRAYQRFLEAVTMRAKIEQALSLTIPQNVPQGEGVYWPREALIPRRHLKSRLDRSSSEEFLDKEKHQGYQRITRFLVRSFQAAALILLVLLFLASFLTL